MLEKYIFTDWDEEERKIRVKFWRGKVTHRYRRFLNRMSRNIDTENLDSMETILANGRRK